MEYVNVYLYRRLLASTDLKVAPFTSLTVSQSSRVAGKEAEDVKVVITYLKGQLAASQFLTNEPRPVSVDQFFFFFEIHFATYKVDTLLSK